MPENEKLSKEKMVETTIETIRRQFGDGSIMKYGQNERPDIEVIPTGSLALDIALGIGGFPRGRIVEVYGAESSGKTTLALHSIAEAQKLGGVAAFIDAEHALDPSYAQKLGVKIEDLIISQPDNGEQALEITDVLVKSGAIDIIVIDSVAALVPRSEIEGDMGDSFIGAQARLMSQAMRKLTGSISKSKTILLFINQVRMKISTVPFGNPETTPGGLALKFYSSVIVNIKKIEDITQGDEKLGIGVKMTVKKNKLSPPFKVAETVLLFDRGFSKELEIIELASKLDIIKKTGTWFSYQDIKLGQGKMNAADFLVANKEISLEIENKIREYYSVKPVLSITLNAFAETSETKPKKSKQ
ncbi:MAG: recombinase RecA [Spirochaetes bacterium]|nr:recombinase RecA [Spirochaetota bacterium]HOV46504.1 recombinase RecA [Exilispira sp.]MBP8991404.1 recombinase RecA [Spirochaetota bacterium]HQJ40193.1 recombinase RecA [Exilispira sp.]HQM89178.1 recombinase RecA [Exilispira sp.]